MKNILNYIDYALKNGYRPRGFENVKNYNDLDIDILDFNEIEFTNKWTDDIIYGHIIALITSNRFIKSIVNGLIKDGKKYICNETGKEYIDTGFGTLYLDSIDEYRHRIEESICKHQALALMKDETEQGYQSEEFIFSFLAKIDNIIN